MIVEVEDVWPGCVLRWLVVVVWIVCSKRPMGLGMTGRHRDERML